MIRFHETKGGRGIDIIKSPQIYGMESAPLDGTEILIFVNNTFRRAKYSSVCEPHEEAVNLSSIAKRGSGCWILIDDMGQMISGCTVSEGEIQGWLPWDE